MLAFSWFSELLSCAIRSLCKRIPFKLIVKRLALLSLFFVFFFFCFVFVFLFLPIRFQSFVVGSSFTKTNHKPCPITVSLILQPDNP